MVLLTRSHAERGNAGQGRSAAAAVTPSRRDRPAAPQSVGARKVSASITEEALPAQGFVLFSGAALAARRNGLSILGTAFARGQKTQREGQRKSRSAAVPEQPCPYLFFWPSRTRQSAKKPSPWQGEGWVRVDAGFDHRFSFPRSAWERNNRPLCGHHGSSCAPQSGMVLNPGSQKPPRPRLHLRIPRKAQTADAAHQNTMPCLRRSG